MGEGNVKFIIKRGFPLASGGLGGCMLVGKPEAALNAFRRKECPRMDIPQQSRVN